MGLEPIPSPPRPASCIRPEAGGVVFSGSEPPSGGMVGRNVGSEDRGEGVFLLPLNWDQLPQLSLRFLPCQLRESWGLPSRNKSAAGND